MHPPAGDDASPGQYNPSLRFLGKGDNKKRGQTERTCAVATDFYLIEVHFIAMTKRLFSI
jgi:hypothetical protein